MTPNRIAAAAGAVAFGLVGVWGLVASLVGGADPAVGVLLAGLLSTNPWLAAVHLVIAGALAVGAVRGERIARPVNVAVGTLLLALGLFGLFSVGTPANVLALGGVANVLHFAAAAGLLATGLGAARPDDAA